MKTTTLNPIAAPWIGISKNTTLNPMVVAWISHANMLLTEEKLVAQLQEISFDNSSSSANDSIPPPLEYHTIITRHTVFKPNIAVQSMMEKMGWIPGMGLGARLQGILIPIDTDISINSRFIGAGRKGLGYYKPFK